jgi:hypothetical protein
MKVFTIFGAIGLGFVLLLASVAWSKLFPATSSWSPEKAARWIEVKNRIYDLSFTIHGRSRPHGGPDPATAKQEYEELQKENEQLTADFESAASRPNTISSILKWSGVSLAALGIIGWYALKDSL